MKPVFRAVALAVAVSDYLGGNVHAKRFIGRPSRRPRLLVILSRRGPVALAAIVRRVGVRSRAGRVGDRSGGPVILQGALGVRRAGAVVDPSGGAIRSRWRRSSGPRANVRGPAALVIAPAVP